MSPRAASSVALGAPGVYEMPGRRVRALTGVRMDVCAFVGVAPRGPARERPAASPWLRPGGPEEGRVRVAVPVAVESWGDYRRLFGGFEGPGRLPYAVHAFFRQGGRRAWIVRVVHRYGDVRDREGVAWGAFPGVRAEGRRGLRVRSARGGADGAGTRVRLRWDVLALTLDRADDGTVVLDASEPVEPGALLRLALPGGEPRLAFVDSVRDAETGGGAPALAVALRDEPPAPPTAVERVEAVLEIEAPDGTAERHERLGLAPGHPRWLAAMLEDASSLLEPDPRWRAAPLLPLDPALPDPGPARPLAGGLGALPAVGRVPGVEPVGDGLWFRARNEGAWGDRLRAELSFTVSPVRAHRRGPRELVARPGAAPPRGALLRATLEDDTTVLTYVIDVVEEWADEAGAGGPFADGGRVDVLALDRPLPVPHRTLEEVEAELRVVEEPSGRAGSPARAERHRRLGLAPDHPRWLHDVVARESGLTHPDPEWAARRIEPSPELATTGGRVEARFAGGRDRYRDLVPDDFFDPDWRPTGERGGAGVHAVAELREPALLVVPDLYSPEPLAPFESVVRPSSLAGPEFAPCVEIAPAPEQARPVPRLEGLRLDPTDAAERETIIGLQQRLESLADARRSFVALLDVPPGLDRDRILRWRDRFGSDFVAAYHPWLRVSVEDDRRDSPVRLNPAAIAAGIVAAREIAAGIQDGPANELAVGAVDVADAVSPAAHDTLHPAGINVFLRERDGVRLLGARTLAARPAYRQLSVRRLVTMVARTLERRMQWTVFEPNDARLRGQLRHLLTGFMRELYRAGALTGATEEEAFFVRCDDVLNPPRGVDAGRLVAEIGLAPAEPVEFLLLRVVRDADGGVRVEG